jgi:uracil permease
VSNKVDFSINRNLMIASVVIILGVGMETAGISLPLGDYTLPGMATSALIGIVMNLIIPKDEEETSPDDGKSVTEEPKAEVEASK